MSFVAALLIVAQLGTRSTCTFKERPAPSATRSVQALLRSEHPSRADAERARHYAVMKGDAVGEAQGNFILARIAFERTGKWPAIYLQRAAAACAKGGCGPEMMEGLFGWADVVGPRSPVFQQAIELAFSVAEHETLRPRAAVDQLLVAETILESQRAVSAASAAARSRRVVSEILRKESNAVYDKNPARMASAGTQLGDLLASDKDLEGAGRAYLNAAATWSSAGCRPESVGALMKWALALDSAKARRTEMNDVLDRALLAAEKTNIRIADTDDAISGYRSVWKDASPANQRSYLQLRRTLITKIGSFDALRLESLARDAEELNDWNLAFELYSRLLKSAQEVYEKKTYLEALSRAADKLGRQKEAADYRQQASKLPEPSPSATASALAATGGGGGGASNDQPSPWKPPERPGKEGGTPGERRRDPQR